MRQLGKYSLLEEIGQGGMGSVYRARDEVIGRDVAIKLIHERVLHIPEIRERFFREASAAGRLTHPNIVVVHDVGDDDGMPFIVMELLGGASLRKIISGTPQPKLEDRLSIAIQLAEGLGYAHKHEVIHRDVKPENVQVLERNHVKVLDFGIARLGTDSRTLTRASLGTPRFMSPEQIKGHKVDHRTDIFSFGVVLYELLTGSNPFAGEHLTTIIYKILHETPEPIHLAESDLSRDLQEIVSGCLEKDADKRYQDFDVVVAGLSKVLAKQQYATHSGATGGLRTDSLRRTAADSVLVEGGATSASRIGRMAAGHRVRPLYLFGAATLVLVLALVSYLATTAPTAPAGAESSVVSPVTQEGAGSPDGMLVAAKQAALAERDSMLVDKARADSLSARTHASAAYGQALNMEEAARRALERGDAAGLKEATEAFSGAGKLYRDAVREASLALAGNDTDALKQQASKERQTMLREKGRIESLRNDPRFKSDIAEADRIGNDAQRQLNAGRYAEAIRAFGNAGQKFRSVRDRSDTMASQSQAAQQARTDAVEARQNVAAMRDDPERAAAFRQAESLYSSAGEQFAAGRYPQAAKLYGDAQQAYTDIAKAAASAASAQRTAQRQDAEQARDDVRKAKATLPAGTQGGGFEEAQQIEQRADQSYASASYEDASRLYKQALELYKQSPPAAPTAPPADEFVRGITGRVRDDFEQENLADLRSISAFFDSWGEFFKYASNVKAVAKNDAIEADGSRASFTMQLTLTYTNNKNEASVLKAPLHWTLERSDSAWKVVSVRAAN
ncbi:MAG TPA: serine/threonine-protein kinase [Rhodothermales bacterium]|nr:serine/threonine-protein kinase [Rhodothermales bacterium]